MTPHQWVLVMVSEPFGENSTSKSEEYWKCTVCEQMLILMGEEMNIHSLTPGVIDENCDNEIVFQLMKS